jgi:N-acetylgalactosamine-6-sulfatase
MTAFYSWIGFLLLTQILSAADRTNVLFILVDDMGYGDLSCYGAPDVKTPNIDQIASQGVRFTQYYANGAECTPTRTALLTGRYPQRVKGLECAIGTGNVGRYDDAIAMAAEHQLGLPAEKTILPRAFKEAGYATGIYGKWHLGYEPHFHPKHHGFDHFFGVLGGNCDYFTHREFSEIPVLYRQHTPVEESGYMTHLITKEALEFLDQYKDKPFFLYVPYTTPHFPFQTPADADNHSWTEENFTQGSRKSYVTMLEDMDTQVGILLDRIDAHKLSDTTLVVFGSDHGGMGPSLNAPFRGSKGSLFEGGIRTAMMARWPEHLPAGLVSDQPCMTIDFTYSLARITGLRQKERSGLDGMDILQHLTSKRLNTPRTMHWRARRGNRTWKAIRHGDWKYVHKIEGGNQESWLFDLASDPEETHNRLQQASSQRLGLQALLERWEAEVRLR